MDDKGDPIFDLEKVPDSVVIKSLRVEVGILKSEIDELNYIIGRKQHPHAKNSEYIISMEGQIRNLKAKIDQLESNEDTMDLKAVILARDRQVALLKQELFKLLKDK